MSARIRTDAFFFFVALAAHLGVTVEELGEMRLADIARKARS